MMVWTLLWVTLSRQQAYGPTKALLVSNVATTLDNQVVDRILGSAIHEKIKAGGRDFVEPNFESYDNEGARSA